MLPGAVTAVPSLAAAYRGCFPVGAAVSPPVLAAAGDLVAHHLSGVTAENEMKWERIHPREWCFGPADTVVAFARAHGLRVRGHTLVWHRQTPGWVFHAPDGGPVGRDELLRRLRDHVKTILGRYRGRIQGWDVVNEALSDDTATVWRFDSPWHGIAGEDEDGDGLPDYLVAAFRCARAADPEARLFYNDYNIEKGAKHENALDLVARLRWAGLIDGVGIQGHWSIHDVDPEGVRRAVEAFAALGVDVEITELDLSVYRSWDRTRIERLDADLETLQARGYGELFRVFRELGRTGRLQGVTLWGVADDHTWLDDFPVPGRKDWPLLFDTGHTPKMAFRNVAVW